jgi:branched-chain amino acid:cation transporter, LIVCS family
MKDKWLIFNTGFALFAMFFGSGNLVFPLAVGQDSEGHYLLAAFGIFLTGVFVPFLGTFGMMLHEGSIQSFFKSFGKTGIFWFSLFALALMGPFGVLARCLTVAHGAVLLILPFASLPVTSFALCVVIYLLTINKNKIVTILGTWLTPFLLVCIAMIAFFALKQRPLPEVSGTDLLQPLFNGFFQGYQTMDLLAAFFFSNFIIKQLKHVFSHSNQPSAALNVFLKASLVGAALLSIVYLFLVLLGWAYAPILQNVPAQEKLGIIAIESLGPIAAPCVCGAIVLACLTTAIALASLFADFLRKEVCQNKLGQTPALLATLAIGFCVSTFDFSGISRFLGPILEAIYPVLILFTLGNIAHKLWINKQAKQNQTA